MARGGRGGRANGRVRAAREGRNNRVDKAATGPSGAGQHRSNVSPGTLVEIIQKRHQRTGQLTTGVVSGLLTKSGYHPRGIKVKLSGGVVGRVHSVPSSGEGHASRTHGFELVPNIESGDDSNGASRDGNYINTVYTCTSPSNLLATGAASRSTIGRGRRRQHPRPQEARAARSTLIDNNRSSTNVDMLSITRSWSRMARESDSTGVAVPSHSPHPPRHVRRFLSARVQGRSWSLNEDGQLVATSE